MSLETLLEAAKYVELGTSTAKAREHDTQDFHPYAKTAPPQNKRTNGEGGSSPDGGSDDGQKRRYGGAGTREVHNKLEKNRRAHLKECFEALKKQVPNMEDKKTSNLSILRGALRHIQSLKWKEREFEQEMQRLAQEKINTQERIIHLKRELAQMNIEYDLNNFIKDEETESDSTATAEGGSPIVSDCEDEEVAPKPIPLSPVGVAKTEPRPPVVKLQQAAGSAKSVIISSVPLPKSQAAGVLQITPNHVTKTVTTVTFTAPRTVLPTTSVSAGVNTQVVRTPVTQLLHQTIKQRAVLQQQQKLQQQVTTVQGQLFQPMTVRQSMASPAVTAIKPMTAIAQLQQALAVNRLVAPAGASFITPASILAAPLASTTAAATVAYTAVTKQTKATIQTQASTTTSHVTSNPAVTAALAAQAPSGATVAIPNLAALKHIITTPITQVGAAQIISPTAMQLSQLMNHTIGRTTLAQVVASTTATTTSTVTPVVSATAGVPSALSTIAQVAAGTQFISPISVVSPLQIAPNLVQGQLGTLGNNSVIKPLGPIPIIQQSFNLQQQIIKPVVMVPGVVSTTNIATTTAQAVVTLAVSNSS